MLGSKGQIDIFDTGIVVGINLKLMILIGQI